MRLKVLALLSSAALIAACDQSDPVPTPETPVAESPAVSSPAVASPAVIDFAKDIPKSLTAGEAANFATALAQLPPSAKLAHAVADGNVVILHYGIEGAEPVSGAETFEFDAAHAITKRDKLETKAFYSPFDVSAVTLPASAEGGPNEVYNRSVVVNFLGSLAQPAIAAKDAPNVLAPSYKDHSDGTTRDAYIASLAGPGATQYSYDVKAIAGWNDLIAVRSVVSRTGADGKATFVPGFDLFRLDNGLISERWRINY